MCICSFSALQRAENSSIYRAPIIYDILVRVSVLFSEPKIPQFYNKTAESGIVPEFQCSSASRKFLNVVFGRDGRLLYRFQCSSASRKFLNPGGATYTMVKQHVSVLFSEPKIPQSTMTIESRNRLPSFSALQRAENSSICVVFRMHGYDQTFQCSSASRKFLNLSFRL